MQSSKSQILRSKPTTAQARVHFTPLTPFLYQTRTLVGQAGPLNFIELPCRSRRRDHRDFSLTSPISAPAYFTDQDAPSKYRFSLPGSSGKANKSPIPQNNESSLSQNALSEMIYSKLSDLVSDKSTGGENKSPVDGTHEGIIKIFENVGKELEADEQHKRRITLNRNEADVLRRRIGHIKEPALRASDLSVDFSEVPLLTTEGLYEDKQLFPSKDACGVAVDEFRDERRNHEKIVRRELAGAQTDFAVWSVLETQVFSLIETIKNCNEKEGKQEQCNKKSSKRKTRKYFTIRKGSPDGTYDGSISIKAPSPSPELQPISVVLPPDVTLSIVQHNYGPYCLEALQLFRREFPTSPYAQKILPTIKTLGAISYVLGATSGLYNELLYLRWTQYHDLHGMAELLQEMKNRGVELNEVTTALILGVQRERTALLGPEDDEHDMDDDKGDDEYDDEDLKKGQSRAANDPHIRQRLVEVLPGDSNMAAWWRLRGVHDRWDRLWRTYCAAKRQMRERRLRELRDEQDMRAAAEEDVMEEEETNEKRGEEDAGWELLTPEDRWEDSVDDLGGDEDEERLAEIALHARRRIPVCIIP